jgi:hypothetical protein
MTNQSFIAARDRQAHGRYSVAIRDLDARRSGFIPHLFIGIGETNAYFTLRETHQDYIPGDGPMGNATVNGVYQGRVVTASHHIKNLSQDAHEAFAKAREYADAVGLELRANVERMKEELRDIHRSTAEQIAKREETRRLDQERRDERERQWIEGCKRSIDDGLVPFGRYAGAQIAETPIQWRQWVTKSTHENEVMAYLADAVARRHTGDFPPTPVAGVTVGTVGERLTLRVRCIARFIVRSDFGDLYITKMVDLATGALLVVKSGSWSMTTEDPETTIKATVKKHDEYRGEVQTVLQRVKEVAS